MKALNQLGMANFFRTIFSVLSLLLSASSQAQGTSAMSDCLFNWGEKTYPTVLTAASSPASSIYDGYYYRYYIKSNSYIAVSNKDNHLYYLAPLVSPNLLDLGETSLWYSYSKCDNVTITLNADPWFHNYLKNSDGSETLILTTIDGSPGAFGRVTPATPIMMLKPNEGGVTDITSQLFDNAPSLFWGRNVVAYKDPITLQPAIWFCNTGREVGDYNLAPTPRVNGVWGEQDRLYIMENGKFVDRSSQLPQVVDFTHGCAAAHIGDGNSTLLVKNTLGVFGGNPAQQVLANNGSGYLRILVPTDASNINWHLSMWWAGAGDFSKRGADDIVFSQQVMRYENGVWRVTQTMTAPDLEAQGWTNYHSGIVADLNGDGYPDAIQILSGGGGTQPFLSGVMLAVFMNDGAGNLVYKPNAIPSDQAPTEMGLEFRVFDVNFDGKMDIVTSGARYFYQSNGTELKARTVYVSNGDGTFSRKKIVDPELDRKCAAAGIEDWGCQRALYFMANSDSKSYSLMMMGTRSDSRYVAYSRIVTASDPLVLQ